MKKYMKLSVCLYALYLFSTGCKKEALQEPTTPQNNYSTTSSARNRSQEKHATTLPEHEMQGIRQLYCKDIKPGDIMLKVNDGGWFNKTIALFQKGTLHKNYEITHVGIMRDCTTIIEADDFGLEEGSLKEKNSYVSYVVYRTSELNKNFVKKIDDGFDLGQAAGSAATLLADIHKEHRSIRYNVLGLLPAVSARSGHKPKSATDMEKIYEKIIHKGGNHRMFCSQFAVYVYQWAASQMGIAPEEIFNANDAKTTPAGLAEILQNNPHFTKIGYLISNER